ncbi:RHOMBOID-like protein 12, mitochondrial [Lolium rigidum]|uniref:RHOMBOID-like protein 12, mitochondrial n=1 Tax=Lolium rigidum TaxID=89674 RepID=UPI001F5C78BE|nr:RHOMBOID-like protein 12, mitochondrial [Lolium rigidum]
MAAMRRLQPVLAQQAALRRALHSRRLHSPFPLAAASASPLAPAAHSPSPTPSLLPRSTGSLLPASAGAVVAAARSDTARNAGSLEEPLSLQLSRASGCFASSSSTLLHGVAAPWAHWTTTPADDMVLMLAGANVAVYGLWLLADPNFGLGPSVISLDNFKSLRLHTLLTCAFSHKDPNHIGHNMMGLYFFGSSIAHTFGPDFLLKLYVQGALLGSAFYLTEMAFLAPQKQGFGGWNTPALGASAAVNATVLLYIFLYPTNILYLHFIIPLPAALVGAYLIGADLRRVKKGNSHVAGSAHLGGAVVAALVFAEMKGWI